LLNLPRDGNKAIPVLGVIYSFLGSELNRNKKQTRYSSRIVKHQVMNF